MRRIARRLDLDLEGPEVENQDQQDRYDDDDEDSRRPPPDYFDAVRASATDVRREGNLDVVRVAAAAADEDGGGSFFDELRFCHLAAFLPITHMSHDVDDGTVGHDHRISFSDGRDVKGMAAVLLALKHLNTGDGSVVNEVDGLDGTCDVRFTAEVFDTELSEYTAVDRLLNLLRRDGAGDGEERPPLPCAFLGSQRSAVSMPTSIITSISGYPHFSHFSTSSALDDKSQYKLFGRVIPSDDGTSIPVIQYLRKRLNVRHLGVIHGDDSYGIAFARSLQKAAARHAPDMKILPVEIPFHTSTSEDIETAVRLLASTQYRYFFAVVEGTIIYKPLMEEAYRQGIAGDGYTWMFSDAVHPSFITSLELEAGSPLERATRGISMLAAEGGLPGMPVHDRFVSAFRGLNNDEDDVRYVESKIPRYEDEGLGYVPPRIEDLLNQDDPGTSASFLYDSTIALGLAACRARNESANSNSSAGFDGTDHYHATLASNFVGASGRILFDNTTGSRDPNSAVFQLTNFVRNRVNERTGTVKFSAVRSDVFRDGEWQSVTPYVFSDGTSNIPLDLPKLDTNYTYIGSGLRGAGLALSAIVLLLSAGFSLWTFLNRKRKVVKASQGVFLHILCFGTFLMGASIIPLSIDDEVASTEGCDIACMSSIWLLTIGFAAAFGALFSKTWRINKIFYHPDMRRVKFSARDAIKPMIVVVAFNVLVLSLWSALSPLQWVRSVTGIDVFGRTAESRGRCKSDTTAYAIVLAVINGCALVTALYQVYRARHVKNEFGETRCIALAIAGMLLVALVGVPVMIIASENPQANFFVLSCIIFAMCTLLLLFIMVPKVRFHREVENGDKSIGNVVTQFSRQSTAIALQARGISGRDVGPHPSPPVQAVEEGRDLHVVAEGEFESELTLSSKEIDENGEHHVDEQPSCVKTD